MAPESNIMQRLFLGIDSSTQSLSAVLIDCDNRKVVYEQSLNLTARCRNTARATASCPIQTRSFKHSPPLMWAGALDLLFAKMKKTASRWRNLAISGSGQQHGSVIFNDRAAARAGKIKSPKDLAENLRGVFTRPTSPIGWIHPLPKKRQNPQKLGGIKATAQQPVRMHLSGSPARKSAVLQNRAEAYAQTARHRARQFVHGVAARRENRGRLITGDGAA